jgi:ubiquinone/menaquinone biosynthesis C-methylase UbiE
VKARVEYDRVAPDYDRRYEAGGLPAVERALRRATLEARAQRVLEVGCGTGHWLSAFGVALAYGADRSLGMLARAAAKRHAPGLVAADAQALPFREACFGLVACVNALHHFPEPRAFVERAAALLCAGGGLIVIGMDPGARRDRWYLYDYFPDTERADLERYPAHAAIRQWMRGLGLERVTTRAAQRIHSVVRGAEVLEDPILHRHGTSQLTLLDDDAFDRGMARIHDAIRGAGEPVEFTTDIVLSATRGFFPR